MNQCCFNLDILSSNPAGTSSGLPQGHVLQEVRPASQQ